MSNVPHESVSSTNRKRKNKRVSVWENKENHKRCKTYNNSPSHFEDTTSHLEDKGATMHTEMEALKAMLLTEKEEMMKFKIQLVAKEQTVTSHLLSTEIEHLREELRAEKIKNSQLTRNFENKRMLLEVSCSNRIAKVERELKKEREEYLIQKSRFEKLETAANRLFTEEQLEFLQKDSNSNWTWSDAEIVNGLTFRYNLGVDGFEFLHSTGYPVPGFSTLCRRTQDYTLEYGVFTNLKNYLEHTVQNLPESDRYCFLSLDEMAISSQTDFDKNSKQYYGYTTLEEDTETQTLGTHLLLAIIRAVKGNYKQIIGNHVTGSKVNGHLMKQFVAECLSFVEGVGLTVVAVGSDMGPNNRNLWRAFDFHHEVHFLPDPVHLLKNLKSAMLKNDMELPWWFVDDNNLHNLLSKVVSGKHVIDLWVHEMLHNKEIRSLYHLNYDDIYPDNFKKMHAGSAVRFFSLETAAALELAVHKKILPTAAVSTARFIKFIYAWFACITSRCIKTS